MNIIKAFMDHINYIGAATLFVTGLYTVLTHSNILKKVIGLNVIETSVFLFFVSVGYVTGGKVPILEAGMTNPVFVNPLPTGLILTGIVVAVSVSAYSLSLVVRLYESYGTLDMDEIMKLRSGQVNE